MDRKGWLILAVAALIVVSAAVAFAFQAPEGHGKSFTIVHTNDSHCHYDDADSVGFRTVSALKRELSGEGPTFTVDAGDFLSGSPCGLTTHGASSVEVMNSVGYDVGIPGNHEFDFGLGTLLERAEELNHPLICANLVYEATGDTVFPGYLIIEKGGIRVGFFGLITDEAPYVLMDGCMGGATVTDPVEAAGSMVSILKREKVDCIVAIGHLGVNIGQHCTTSDMLCNRVPGIDIFIDGHSHAEMEDGKLCDGSRELLPSDTTIACTGSFMKNVGIVRFSADGISAKLYRGPALNDTVTEEAIRCALERADERLGSAIGCTEVTLVGERVAVRNEETNLGDLITDLMRIDSGCQIAAVNAGNIRTSIYEGPIVLREIYDVDPLLRYVCRMEVPGSVIWEMMEISLSKAGLSKSGYLQFSGMTVTYDPEAESGHRVVSITVGDDAIDRAAAYSLVTTDDLCNGGDGYGILSGFDAQMYDTLDIVLIEGISGMATIHESDIIGNRLVAIINRSGPLAPRTYIVPDRDGRETGRHISSRPSVSVVLRLLLGDGDKYGVLVQCDLRIIRYAMGLCLVDPCYDVYQGILADLHSLFCPASTGEEAGETVGILQDYLVQDLFCVFGIVILVGVMIVEADVQGVDIIAVIVRGAAIIRTIDEQCCDGDHQSNLDDHHGYQDDRISVVHMGSPSYEY
jgi:5'-nucleotidase